MKKHPFINILTRFFRKLKISYSYNNNLLIVNGGGLLKTMHVQPRGNYVAIDASPYQLFEDVVRIQLNVCVNNSLETFLYKLFRFNVITIDTYTLLLKKWQS